MKKNNIVFIFVLAFIFGSLGSIFVNIIFKQQFVVAQSDYYDVIKAQKFKVVDKYGNIRAVLDVDSGGGVGMAFYDKKQIERLSLGYTSDGDSSAIYVSDENGIQRAGVFYIPSKGPSIAVADKNAKATIALAIPPSSGPGIALTDEKGRKRIGMGIPSNGPGIVVFNQSDLPIWHVP